MTPASRTALHRLGALALVLGLILCLLLPGILCRAELAALERSTLERPILAIELDQTGREDPLALALYQGRTLYDSSDVAQYLDLDRESISAQLTQAVDRLTGAGVLDDTARQLAGELLDSQADAAGACRMADGTLTYSWPVYSTEYYLSLTWHPDLELPLSLEIAHTGLPGTDPLDLLDRWMAFLGEDVTAPDWQRVDGVLEGVASAWSPSRQLLLTVYGGAGRRAVRVYSVSEADYRELLAGMAEQENQRLEEQAWMAQARKEDSP